MPLRVVGRHLMIMVGLVFSLLWLKRGRCHTTSLEQLTCSKGCVAVLNAEILLG